MPLQIRFQNDASAAGSAAGSAGSVGEIRWGPPKVTEYRGAAPAMLPRAYKGATEHAVGGSRSFNLFHIP